MLKGSCLCGAVTFEMDDRFMAFHLCHCQQCRKMTGSAHAANLFTTPNNIRWLSGETQLARYDVPGRTISNAFCRQCASALPYLSLSGKALVVPAGSLDDAPSIVPQDHLFWAERAPWYQEVQNCPCYEGFPPG
ncbi:GFA family protein [Gallaecimonas pentaromativorans]|uniref:GFA family protein n=1 Tax=Gallaecimonas pentaromativorans TaxID=584787 RepID=UPI003A91C8B8